MQNRKPIYLELLIIETWRRAWQATPVFLHGESPWTEEPGKLPSTGPQRIGHNSMTKNRHIIDTTMAEDCKGRGRNFGCHRNLSL